MVFERCSPPSGDGGYQVATVATGNGGDGPVTMRHQQHDLP